MESFSKVMRDILTKPRDSYFSRVLLGGGGNPSITIRFHYRIRELNF